MFTKMGLAIWLVVLVAHYSASSNIQADGNLQLMVAKGLSSHLFLISGIWKYVALYEFCIQLLVLSQFICCCLNILVVLF